MTQKIRMTQLSVLTYQIWNFYGALRNN